jgi:hypothetical protein
MRWKGLIRRGKPGISLEMERDEDGGLRIESGGWRIENGKLSPIFHFLSSILYLPSSIFPAKRPFFKKQET